MPALAALNLRNSVSADGSTLSLQPFKGGLVREIISPDGATTEMIYTLRNGSLGTVSGGDRHVIGMFALKPDSLSTIYADGRLEILNLGPGETITIRTSDGEGETFCSSFYPAGLRAARNTDGCSPGTPLPGALPDQGETQLSDSQAWDAFDRFYVSFVAGHEGGYSANDGNGSPANYGVNQGANPDIAVRSLNRPEAEQILFERYWLAAGADRLPTALGMVHGDTAINMGVKAANELLAQSGGDVEAYLDLRDQKYRSIAASNPDKTAYLSLWLTRNDDLRQLVDGAQDGTGERPSYAGYRPDRDEQSWWRQDY